MYLIKNKTKNYIKKIIKNKKNIFLFGTILFFLTSLGFYNFTASSALDNISGYVWGGSRWTDTNFNNIEDSGELMATPGGMGWLSLNCSTGGNCGDVNYGINIGTDGYITGYAWSSNYGWMKFGGLQNFPTGGGTVGDNAKLVGNNITGWARFCAPSASPTNCTGYVKNLRNGGWDGWVALSGNAIDSTPYGLNLNIANGAGILSGYAWGGNNDGANVVGWINFSNANYQEVVDPTVTISANPINLPVNSTTVLSWTGINIESSSTGCTATGDWSGSRPYPAPVGGVTIGPLATGTYTYSIQCMGPLGVMSNISSVEVNVGGTTALDFYAAPSPSYPPYQTTLHWNDIPATPGLHSCVASSAPPLNIAEVPNWTGTVPDPSPLSSAVVSVPYNPTNYKLTCLDSLDQTVSAQVSVPQGTLPESVSLSSNGVTEGPPGTYTTTLSWSTINANSCVASGGGSGGNWTTPLNKNTPGSQSGVSVPPIAPAFTTYTLTCVGAYSGQSIAVSIQLNQGSGRTFNIVRPTYKED